MGFDDLVQSGIVGLIEAAIRYKDDGVPFDAFARKRIKGAMIDEIRYLNYTGRKKKDLPFEICSLDSQIGESNDMHDVVPDKNVRTQPGYVDYIDLWDTVEQLEHCAKIVIKHYYREDIKLKKIGEMMSVSEGRVCQIKNEAIKKMQNFYREA